MEVAETNYKSGWCICIVISIRSCSSSCILIRAVGVIKLNDISLEHGPGMCVCCCGWFFRITSWSSSSYLLPAALVGSLWMLDLVVVVFVVTDLEGVLRNM